MKILIVTGIFPPDIGGPASYVPSIAKAFAAKGHEIWVITLSDTAYHDDTGYPFPVIRIRRFSLKLLRLMKTVIHIIRRGRNADLLYVHGLAFESVLANFFLKKPLVQKVVGDLVWERARTLGVTRDGIDDFQKTKYSVFIELLKTMRSFWTGESHLIITPSLYLKRILLGWGIPEEKIKVIYNAVQLPEADRSAPPEFFQPLDLDQKKIVSVGRLVPWKGFEFIIKAVYRIPRTHLFIIGEGPDRPKLESLIKQKKLDTRVHLLGSCSRAEVFHALQHADLFVLNSSYEGLPHIVLEAMAAGAPVIATDTGGTAELIRHRYNGLLIPPSVPQVLERSIKDVLNDNELRDKLVQHGYETIKNFDWGALVDETEKALLDTIKNKNAPLPLSRGTDANGRIPVLFLSTAKFSNPPEPTLVKKWQGLRPFFNATVISHKDGRGPSRQMLEGSQWILLPSSGLPRGLRYLLYFLYSFMASFIGALNNKYRVILAQSPFQAIAPALALLPWQIARAPSRPKLIIEVHNDWKEGVMLYHRSRFAWIEKALRSLAGGFSLSRADAFRVISDYCRELVPARTRPVYVFPTFTDLESFKKPAPELIDTIAKKHGRGFFIYAGMLIYLKGVHHLIKAFHKLLEKHPEAQLIIAGTGKEAEGLKGLAKKTRVGGRIHFVGHLDQNALAAYIKNSLALVLPSLTEGLGRVAIEAHLLERPVIASRTGGIPEVVLDGKTGLLIAPGNEEALYSAMVALLENPALAASMGR
ncbi:MAG: glycosyltransferase family 4 protein, partial [Pseudomonadota bacterium]